jgi:hypothetical protein
VARSRVGYSASTGTHPQGELTAMAFPNSPRARTRPSTARILTIAAFVCAVIALLVAPLIFAILGIILGVVGAYLGDRPLGWYAAGASLLVLLLTALII